MSTEPIDIGASPLLTFFSVVTEHGATSFQRGYTVPEGAMIYDDEPSFNAALEAIRNPEPTLNDKKATVAAQIDQKRDTLIGEGYQHNFGGTAGIRTLDNRNEADAINWLGLKGIADMLIARGEGDQKVSIVAADNSVFEASADTVASSLISMALWRSGLVLNARALKNAVTSADDEAALDAIDIEAGWTS